MGRYLVTGAAGFIGSHLAETLVARGDTVVGIDCFTPYYSRAEKEANVAALRSEPAFTLVEEDLVDADLGSLLDGVDGILHLAAQAGVRSSWSPTFAKSVQPKA